MTTTNTAINIRTYIDLSNSNIMECKVTYILRMLGIPAHINGYGYLKSAIIKVVDNPSYIYLITKRLYVDLGKEFDSSASKVERGMRNAIEKIDCDDFTKISFIGKAKDDYTNTEVITGISELLRCSRLMDDVE